jgi:hypothetical protein
MYPTNDTEVDEIEQAVISELQRLGYASSDARKIYCTFDLAMTSAEPQRFALLRRLNHFIR